MKVIPAILPISFRAIVGGLQKVHEVTDTVQIDFVDGTFADNRTWLFNNKDSERYTAIEREEEGLPYWETMNYEFDLMVQDPLEKMDMFIALGPSKIIFHYGSFEMEAMLQYLETLPDIVRSTIAFGIAIGLETPVQDIAPLMEYVDTVQCMGIAHVGFQGQVLDERVYDQVRAVRAEYPDTHVSIDGGVTLENAPRLKEAGADSVVAGSSILGSIDPYGTIEAFEAI